MKVGFLEGHCDLREALTRFDLSSHTCVGRTRRCFDLRHWPLPREGGHRVDFPCGQQSSPIDVGRRDCNSTGLGRLFSYCLNASGNLNAFKPDGCRAQSHHLFDHLHLLPSQVNKGRRQLVQLQMWDFWRAAPGDRTRRPVIILDAPSSAGLIDRFMFSSSGWDLSAWVSQSCCSRFCSSHRLPSRMPRTPSN